MTRNSHIHSMTTDTQNTQLTDGFHLVIDALKANDLDTIFGLVGIPITDPVVWLKRKVCASLVSVMSNMRVTQQQSLVI